MEEVFGYMVYEKFADGSVAKFGKVGVNRAALVNVPVGHHCFVITAANEHGESDYSKEVCIDVHTGQLQGDTQLDRLPPQAQIQPLPDATPNTFTVEWSGSDDAEGIGIDYYDVYVSVNGGPIEPWLLGTKLTRQDYSGVPGQQIFFYVVAVDIGGNQSIPDLASQSQTRIPQPNRPPILPALASVTSRVGEVLERRIQAFDFETPASQLRYSLCESSHASATIDPVTGVFRWYVDPAQVLQTNRFVICVTDQGDPVETSRQTLNVVVEDFLRVELGSLVAGASRTGTLPFKVYSSVPGWYLALTFNTPNRTVETMGFEPDERLVCAAGTAPSGQREWQWMGMACEQGLLASRGLVGQLEIGVSQAQSQVIPISIGQVTAIAPDGSMITDVQAIDGKLIMLGDQPVLDTVVLPGENGIAVYLYGVPGFYYSLDYTSDPTLIEGWTTGWQGTLTKHYERVFFSFDSLPRAFFRAREATTSQLFPMPVLP